jgi:protein-tyrosine phosphatase
MHSILFVCTANICRSPTAVAVLKRMLANEGLPDGIEVASAGTHDYQAGKSPFPFAVEHAKKRGYEISDCAARRIAQGDFDHYDLILTMDKSNIANLRAIAPTRSKQKIELLLEYGEKYHGLEVPDPYGGGEKDFESALDRIEDGCKGLVQLIKRRLNRSL